MEFRKPVSRCIVVIAFLTTLAGCHTSAVTSTVLTPTDVLPEVTLALGVGLPAIPTVAAPSFINHPEPELAVDLSVFNNACGPSGQHDIGPCEPNSPLAALGCRATGKPSNLLAALEPSYPIIACFVSDVVRGDSAEAVERYHYSYSPEGNHLYAIHHGEILVKYVVFLDNEYVSVGKEEDFRSLFAPIETADEALGYVVAVTGMNAYYGMEQSVEYEYFADVIEDTYVKPVSDGYVVHLFHRARFGCGPHPISAVDFHVTFQGDITMISRTIVYHNPTYDGACVD